MKNALSIVCAAGLLAFAGSANAQVTNGGFETGDFTGWTLTNTSFTGVTSGIAHSGDFAVYTGPTTGGASISQNLTGVNAGDQVQVTFWLAGDGAGSNAFSATLDGISLGADFVNDQNGFDYTQFTSTVTVTSANPTLVFNVYHGPAYWYIDDVSATVVPAPTAAAALGMGGLASLRRRRR